MQQNSTLAYCIARLRWTLKEYSGAVSGKSDGFHQGVDLRNFSLQRQTIELEFDASLADLQEVLWERRG